MPAPQTMRCGAPGPSVSVSALIEQYGLWVLFFGALAEGESVLIAAGFAAHRGLLQLHEVIALAAIAGMLGDQISYYLGRHYGERLLRSYPTIARQALRLQPLLERHSNASILSVRFLYGLRTVGPIALGALGVPRLRFAVLNLVGAVLWALAFSVLGYQFGNALQWLLDDLRAVEDIALAAVFAGALGASLWWRLRRR